MQCIFGRIKKVNATEKAVKIPRVRWRGQTIIMENLPADRCEKYWRIANVSNVKLNLFLRDIYYLQNVK